MNATILWLLGGLVAVVWIVAAQTRTRRVRVRPSTLVVVLRWVLLAYGVLLIGLVFHSQQSRHPLDLGSVGLLAVMAALAIAFGVLRGRATMLWIGANGHYYRRGAVAVVVLWVISVGLHVMLDWILDRHSGIGGLGAVTTLAYLVTTITAQDVTVRHRAVTGRAGLPSPKIRHTNSDRAAGATGQGTVKLTALSRFR